MYTKRKKTKRRIMTKRKGIKTKRGGEIKADCNAYQLLIKTAEGERDYLKERLDSFTNWLNNQPIYSHENFISLLKDLKTPAVTHFPELRKIYKK